MLKQYSLLCPVEISLWIYDACFGWELVMEVKLVKPTHRNIISKYGQAEGLNIYSYVKNLLCFS